MKVKKVNEAVDWEKSMDRNDNNLDRIKRLKNLQVDVSPVMGDALEDDEKFDKNSKEVFTKLAKEAEDITPKDPDTGKKITIKPYTEKLSLDENLFKESWTSFGGSWRDQTVKKVNYEEEDISDIAYELMNWYGECFEGWEAADIKDALYGLEGERIPGSSCPIVFTMEEREDDDLDWDNDEDYDESLEEKKEDKKESKHLCEDYGVREYSEKLFDMVQDGLVDSKELAKNLIYWLSEDDIKRYMEVTGLLDDEEVEESLEESKKKELTEEVEDEEDEETVFDFVDERLFGDPSRRNASNYRLTNSFCKDVWIPLVGGKGRFRNVYFYPSGIEHLAGDYEDENRRAPMSDTGFAINLKSEDEASLAKAVADELNFKFSLTPINNSKYKFLAKIMIPESIYEMPIADYLESIGKSITDYRKRAKRKSKED